MKQLYNITYIEKNSYIIEHSTARSSTKVAFHFYWYTKTNYIVLDIIHA